MDQLQLFAANEEIAKFATEAEQTPPTEPVEPKAKLKREPLPAHLERIKQVLSIGEDCPECGGDLSKLGEDVTEELEYILAHVLVSKYVVHLTLYRQSQFYVRHCRSGSTMADWVGKSTVLLAHLADAVASQVKGGAAFFADDTAP